MSRTAVQRLKTITRLCFHLQNKEIADRLGVSQPVGEKIPHTAYAKLGIHKRTVDIVVWKSLE